MTTTTNLAAELALIDVAISTRNATTPPTVAAVASQVRTELTVELARIDVEISTRNATAPATPLNVTDARDAVIAEINDNETKIDLLETKTQADARQAILIAEHDATQTAVDAILGGGGGGTTQQKAY